MNDYLAIRHKLAAVARALAGEHKDRLDELKSSERHMQRPDFLWHFLLQSFGTMGRAAGWAGLSKPENYNRVRYEALAALPAAERTAVAEGACRDGKVRMPGIKADYIVGCFEHIQKMGGPEAAKKQLFQLRGRDAKIQFLKALPGIGDKYARNILMDVYHPDFRDSIAIDARIKSLSQSLGLTFPTYDQHEQFYLDVAREAGVDGWELDRLIFNYLPEFSARLR